MTHGSDEQRPARQHADDSAFVDDAFELALGAFERGEKFDVEALLVEREHLRVQIEDAVRLARDVAVHAPRTPQAMRAVAGYEIEQELGAGSMGTVHLARQSSLGGRRVALKVLPPSLGLSDRSKSRFLAEARALAKLDHPGIVGVHDVVDSEGVVAYAMDWVPGGSLARVLQAWRSHPNRDELDVLAECLGVERAKLAAPNATTWLLQEFVHLARALAVVHAAGLLHRDIKPGNLLVAADGQLLLSDFGLVHDPDSSVQTHTGQFLGTLAYSSPEQLRGDHAAVDARSDLYSFGVTLYEALTLRRPYEASSPLEFQHRAESGVYDAPRRHGARLPRDVETILAKAIDPDPKWRYASAEQLAEDLERLLSFRPILARPAGGWLRLAKAVRRNRRTLLAGSAGALVAIVSSVAVASYFWRTPKAMAALRLQAQIELVDTNGYEGLVAPENSAAMSAILMERLDADWSDNLARGLKLYDSALAMDPLGLFDEREALRFERSIVAMTLAVGTRHADLDQVLSSLDPSLPLTTRAAREWTGPGSVRARTPAELADTSERDRYALGLFGFLLYDSALAINGWSLRPIDAEPDALADGALGEIHLTNEQPALAYPHLRDAFRLASQSAYLCCELADCAVQIDDLDGAASLLDRAEHMAGEVPFESVTRVRADLLVKRGDLRAARTLYADLFPRRSGPRFQEHYANVLSALGDFALEVHVRLANATERPNVVRYERELLDAAERWWCSLTNEKRREVARELLDGDFRRLPPTIKARPVLFAAMHEARRSYESLPSTRRGDPPAPRTWNPPRCDPQQRPVVPSLLELAGNVERCRATAGAASPLGARAREQLLSIWFSPLPRWARSMLTKILVANELAERR